jgi:hypothetical protein
MARLSAAIPADIFGFIFSSVLTSRLNRPRITHFTAAIGNVSITALEQPVRYLQGTGQIEQKSRE